MINVKLSTCAPGWPWARQTPGGSLEWGPFRFHVDTQVSTCDAWVVFESLSAPDATECPPGNVIFVTGEPDSLGTYQPAFLSQFSRVVTGRNDIAHEGKIRIQQGHPWFVEKSYDDLISMQPPHKDREICVISSNKDFSEGHRSRLDFIRALKDRFGDRVEVWGRGIRDFDSKWNLLSRYKYAIVLENYSGPDFLTEKLPDALLAYCFPIYYGCKNWGRYFGEGACVDIDIEQIDEALGCISELLSDPDDYDRRLADIKKARSNYLNNVQFFANLASILQVNMGVSANFENSQLIEILPRENFDQVGGDAGGQSAVRSGLVDKGLSENNRRSLPALLSKILAKF